MKKVFTLTSVLVLAMLIAFACKKSSNSSNNTTTTSTTGSTGVNTSFTNFSIDGGAVSNVVRGADTLPYMQAISTSSAPELQITFNSSYRNTSTPPTGNYPIVPTSSAISNTQCQFLLVTSAGYFYASSGSVNVTKAASPNNVVSFSNIVCTGTAGTHTVSGAIRY